MTQPGIEPWSPRPLVNILCTNLCTNVPVFLVEHYPIKMYIIRYYLSPNITILKVYNINSIIYTYCKKQNKIKTTMPSTKLSSDDDSGVSHGFGTKVSLLFTQSAPIISFNTTWFCWLLIILWESKNKNAILLCMLLGIIY